MKFCLVQPPCAASPTVDLCPPLGLLTLAAVLEERDVEVDVVDLNLEALEIPTLNSVSFYERYARQLLASNADVFGFTSMALESHVSLLLARSIKRLDPTVTILLGGAHFSNCARAMLAAFPWIDFISLGPGEQAIASLVDHLRANMDLEHVKDLAYRIDNKPVLGRRGEMPAFATAPSPRPGYHLVDLKRYFSINPFKTMLFEHARGCVFRCNFCYSPTHWGAGEQRKEIEQVVSEIEENLHFGAQRIFFVSDNFLNNPKLSRALCSAIVDNNLEFEWHAYATLPQLNSRTIHAMASSGCRDLFIGVDAVTSSSKRAFDKPFYRDLSDLSSKLEACLGAGITPTCAFMFDADPQRQQESRRTLEVAAHVNALGCHVRLNLLADYRAPDAIQKGGAPLRASSARVRLLQNTHEIVVQNPLSIEHPELFPFHSTKHNLCEFERFCENLMCASNFLSRYPRVSAETFLHRQGRLWETATHVRRESLDPDSLCHLPQADDAISGFSALVEALQNDELEHLLKGQLRTRNVPCKLSGCARLAELNPFVIRAIQFTGGIDGKHDCPSAPRQNDEQSELCTLRNGRLYRRHVEARLAAVIKRLDRAEIGESVSIPPLLLAGLYAEGVIRELKDA